MASELGRLGLSRWACRLFFWLYLAVVASPALAFAPPDFQGDVFDEVGVLTEEQRSDLKQRIRDLRTNDGIWAAIYVTKSLQGGSIEEAAVSTFEKWKLGQKSKDNGLLVMLAPKERKMHIEVGYGLEGTITDALSKRVIDEVYKPAFRENRFADGLMSGFDVMARAMRQEAPTPDTAGKDSPADNTIDIDWELFFERFFGVWLGNLCLPVIYWGIQRRRVAKGRPRKRDSGGDVRNAFIVFAFLGGVFGLFTAVFGLAFPGDSDIVPGLLGANGIFDLIFFIPFLLRTKKSRSGNDSELPGDDRFRWSSTTSSSSWDSSSDSSSSSDGGSSGGGGASGDY